MKKRIIITALIVILITALSIYLLTQRMIYSGVSGLVLAIMIIVYQVLRIKEKKKVINLEEKQDEKRD